MTKEKEEVEVKSIETEECYLCGNTDHIVQSCPLLQRQSKSILSSVSDETSVKSDNKEAEQIENAVSKS